MYFGFDEDQIAIRDAVAGFLEKRAGVAYLQAAWSDPVGSDTWSVWSELAGMGVQSLLVPDEQGGAGSDWVTMALILAEAGKVALPLPLVETAAIGLPAVVAAGDPAGIAADLIAGKTVLSVAAAPGALAPAASRAGWFLVGGESGPVLFHRDEVEVVAEPSVDRTRDAGRVTPVGPGVPLAGAAVPPPADAGAVGAAAVLIGLGRALVQMTVTYVKDRRQFGVPVGSFQAVKHHLADATMHIEFAAPAVWAAAYALAHPGAQDREERARSVSLAKAVASDAATLVARKALQCHGAMGYTDDYHLHLWLKRVWCLAAAYGSAAEHRRRIGASLGIARAGGM